MAPDEYTQALDKALSDLDKDIKQRSLLIADIAGLRATVRVLSTLVPMSAEKQRQVAQLLALADYATPNLTDEIRSLLTSAYPKAMTAIEVRNAIEDSSNTDDPNISLSACHAALKRMLGDKEVEAGPTKDGKASYRIVLRLAPQMHANAYASLLDPQMSARLSGKAIPTAGNESWRSKAIPVADTTPKAPVPPASMRKKLGLEK
jgi:hypothetical protein